MYLLVWQNKKKIVTQVLARKDTKKLNHSFVDDGNLNGEATLVDSLEVPLKIKCGARVVAQQ